MSWYEVDKQETLEFLEDYLKDGTDDVFVAVQLKVEISTPHEELMKIIHERLRTVKTSRKFGI